MGEAQKEKQVDVAELIRVPREGTETVFELLNELNTDGSAGGRRLVIENRQLQREHVPPVIAKAKARAHVFHQIDAFAKYLNESSVVLADVDRRQICAVLDESVETDREIVTYEAKIHPRFLPWFAMLDSAVSVKKFAIHCMKHRRTVADPDGRDLALTMQQIKASKNIERWEGVGNGSINGVRVELTVNSEKRGELVQIPDDIVIESPVFIDGDTQQIRIDLTIDEIDGTTIVYCTSSDIEQAMHDSFVGTVNELKAMGKGQVGLGVVSHRDWAIDRGLLD